MSSSKRLPSFRSTRDLSLGLSSAPSSLKKPNSDATKKKFTPNVNVKRNVKDDVNDSGSKKQVTFADEKRRDKRSGKPTDSAFNKKHHAEYVQSGAGVFSEGGSLEVTKRSSGGSGGWGKTDAPVMERPVLSKSVSSSSGQTLMSESERMEEKKKLDELLKDDFIADKEKWQGQVVPIELPMMNPEHLFGGVSKTPQSQNDEYSKEQLIGSNSTTPITSFHELIYRSRQSTSSAPQIFQIQLPDVLPCTTTFSAKATMHSTSDKSKLMDDDLDTHNGVVSTTSSSLDTLLPLTDMSDGYIGKIQVHKSGKCRLKIGPENDNGQNSTFLNVDIGTQVAFLQHLMSVENPKSSECTDLKKEEGVDSSTTTRMDDEGDEPRGLGVGQLNMLGEIDKRVIFTPDWSDMFCDLQISSCSSSEEGEEGDS